MKKVLILGGSHRDIPLINAAKELGFYVITLGNRDYYLGHDYSNKAYKVNFNDLDKVREIIRNENIEFLLPGCGEESYLNTVKLAHEFKIGNFDSLEVAKLVHNKWKFKEFCLNHNVSTPKGFLYKKKEELYKLRFPIVVKPTTLSGGRGVQIVKDMRELEVSLNKSKKLCDEVFLEEYIEGDLIAYSIFLNNQKIIYEFFAEDKAYLNEYLIATAYPTKVSSKIQEKLKKDVEKLAEKLSLVNGMFHLQVIIKNEIPFIIDVTRRIPGDLFPFLMEYSDNVKYSQAVVNAYTIGKIECEFKRNSEQSFIIRHCVMPSKNGVYKDISIDSSLEKQIIDRLDLFENGHYINNYLQTQISILFIKLEKFNFKTVKDINTLIKVVIE